MEEKHFNEIYDTYHQRIIHVAYYILGNYALAEDVAQEVFVAFSKTADRLQEEVYVPWLISSAKRKAIDYCKKSYQIHEFSVPISEAEEITERKMNHQSQESAVENVVLDKLQIVTFIDDLCLELKEKNQEWYTIFDRVVLKGEKQEDIARALGISVGNLRVKKHRMKIWISELVYNRLK